MTGVDIREVVAGYGDRMVLDGVSLSVESGRFLGLIGPNGAGKTTLLRTVNGVVTPAAGTVRVRGADVHALSARDRGQRVATVPQSADIAFRFTVRELVAMGRTPYRSRFGRATGDDRTAVDRALDRTDTAPFADRPVDTLSGGERRRVLLARALAQDAPVLLLDEPTADLDIHHQVRTLELVRRLVDGSDKTVVAAIHDVDLAARYCDELAVLTGGAIRAHGPPGDVLTTSILEETFGGRAVVTTDPVTGTPSVTAVGTPVPDGETPRIHVLGHGTEAATTLARLVTAGCRCSVGVLPTGSVAAETADALDVEAVTTPAFRTAEDALVERAAELVAAADVTVVTGTPHGPNVSLAARSDATVTLTERTRDQLRDARHLTDVQDIFDVVETAVPSD